MALVTKAPAYVALDSWFFDGGGGANYGNGKGPRMYVGRTTLGTLTGPNRFAISIPRGTLFDGVPSADAITAFNIKLRVKDGCDGKGSAIRFFLERATGTFSENNYTVDCGVSGDGTAATRWPGPARDIANRASYSGDPAAGTWITVAALALGKWWYANPGVTSLVLVAVAASADLSAYEETAIARRISFYTRHTSSGPYAEMEWNDNQKPNAPIDLTPAPGAKIPSGNGTSATVSARHSDPEGDTASRYQAQWFPAGTTDAQADAGSVAPTSYATVTVNTAHNAVRSHTYSGLPARAGGCWRMRFYDGQWGTFSALRDGTTAYQPSVVNPATEPGTKTPRFYDTITSSDPAGEYATAHQDVVYQDTPGGTITKWDSGKVAVGGNPTRPERTYGGSAIEWGTPYRRRRRLWNKDDVPTTQDASWPSAAIDVPFTQYEPTGAVIRIGATAGPLLDPSTKIDTLTPTLYLSDPSGVNVDQGRLWMYSKATGALLWDSGVDSEVAGPDIAIALPAGIADWGMDAEFVGAVRISGNANMGPQSEQKTGHFNARPGAPYPLSAYHATAQVIVRPDGVVVVDTAQPTIVLPFIDLDRDLGYTDNPTRREIELRSTAGAHVGASPYTITTGITNEWVVPAAILAAETTYKVRGRYDDAAAVRSDWSEYLFVKRSAKPTLSAVTPAAAAVVTDPTPTVAWTFASSSGKAQAGYRLIATQGQTTLYDSGYVAGTAAAHDIPAFVLPNGVSVSWTLEAYDTDGLFATVSRSFTTNFSQPPALTGLFVIPDVDAKALIVTWAESTLSTNEHEATYVYAKTQGGNFRLVATLTDKTDTSIYVRAAAHNLETIIRVTQTNGWMESPSTDASAVLGGEADERIRGTWLVRPDAILDIPHPRHGAGDTQTDLEIFAPPGRRDESGQREKVILNWGTSGYESSFSLFTDDRALLETLRQWKEQSVVSLLKKGDGSVRYVRLTATPETDGVARWVNGDVSYIEVSPAAAGF